jgi:hypothetical protein
MENPAAGNHQGALTSTFPGARYDPIDNHIDPHL